jgi:hypothetical protein
MRVLSPASKCRLCKCTDLDACIIDRHTGDVLSKETLQRRIEERGYRTLNDTVACYWVEPDLCSACVGFGRPTDAEVPPFYPRLRRAAELLAILIACLAIPIVFVLLGGAP